VTSAAELELPAFSNDDVSISGEQLHATLRDLASSSWLARVPNGYLTLDREAGDFFLRCRTATFPGQLIAEVFGVGPGPLREEIDNNILHLAGDRHRRLRNLLNPFFTPRAADQWRPAMRDIIDDICAGLLSKGAGDFVDAVAKPYPAQVIATVIGAPRSDWPQLHEWSHWMQSQFDGPALLNDRDRIERAVVDFYQWCESLVSDRRSAPRDDLVSTLIRAETEDEKLSALELRNLILDIIAGGVDTTHAQLAHGLRLFAQHPDQWELLARAPELASKAADEVLRHEPVTPFGARILTADVTYRDVDFPAGTLILVGVTVANRERDNAAFDITAARDRERILTFGAGAHFCVGQNLARAELEEALLYLAPRLPGLRLDGDPEFGTVQGIYGLHSLPLAWNA